MNTHHNPPRIPRKWRFRWFLQGMGSIIGPTTTPEQARREVQSCVDEMIEAEHRKRAPWWHVLAFVGALLALAALFVNFAGAGFGVMP